MASARLLAKKTELQKLATREPSISNTLDEALLKELMPQIERIYKKNNEAIKALSERIQEGMDEASMEVLEGDIELALKKLGDDEKEQIHQAYLISNDIVKFNLDCVLEEPAQAASEPTVVNETVENPTPPTLSSPVARWFNNTVARTNQFFAEHLPQKKETPPPAEATPFQTQFTNGSGALFAQQNNDLPSPTTIKRRRARSAHIDDATSPQTTSRSPQAT